MSIAIHTGISLTDRRNILSSAAERCRYARLITRIGESYGLIAHGLPDDHGHCVVTCDRRRAGVFAQAVESAMRRSLGLPVPFGRAYFKPVTDQAHLRSLIPYVHGQAEHHGVEVDPYFEASSLPDLVGARVIPGGGCLREALARVAPRVRLARQLPDALQGRSGSRPTIEQAAVAAAAANPPCMGKTPSLEQHAAPRWQWRGRLGASGAQRHWRAR